MLIASMYPCPNDGGSLHDYSFALVRIDKSNLSTSPICTLPSRDVYAYEEGKCNTEKHSGSSHLPYRSLAMGFRELSTVPSAVTSWVFPTPSPSYNKAHIFEMLTHLKALDALPTAADQRRLVRDGFVRFVPHQEAHAGLAVHTSPFDTGFFVTLDGGGDAGDPRDSVFGLFGGGSGLRLHWQADATRESVSWFHERLTEYFGFNSLDNGKVSGLAGYGRVIDSILDYFEGLVVGRDPRSPQLRIRRNSPTHPDFLRANLDNFAFDKLINPAPGHLSLIEDLAGYRPVDVAASGEFFFRRLVTRAVFSLIDEHDVPRNGCFSGGVFNNVRLNQDLSKALQSRAHFSMAPGDAGLALGAALVSVSEQRDFRVKTAFIGPSFSQSEIERTLVEFQLPVRECNMEMIAKLIAEGSVVGWFVGRAEYGPRSLGARSILGDPRSQTIKARLNQLAKRRDFFMPFAPAVLFEHAASITDETFSSPYMQVAVDVSSKGRQLVPAAVHVDGTARVQTVSIEANPAFHSLISAFMELTSVPAVLNTSFNRHGISTISTPRSAIEHLLQGCVEHLYLDGYLVSRSDFSPEITTEAVIEEENTLLSDFTYSLRSKHTSISRGLR